MTRLGGSTIGAQLAWAIECFHGQGHESARLDAEVLLAHVLSCRRIELYTGFEGDMAPRDVATFHRLVEEALAGCPVAYLVGHREFYTLSFAVDRSVLIPRPETEYLVIAALEFAKSRSIERLLDVGTGSGVLAITLARELGQAEMWAVDRSSAALAVALKNARAHGVAERIRFRESDLFASLPPDLRFDLIVTNPPYVASEEWDQLPNCVREYEPRGSLDGGPGGLEVVRRLLTEAPAHLSPDGRLLMEIGAGQYDSVTELARQISRWTAGPVFRDLAGHQRVVALDTTANGPKKSPFA